MKAGIKKNIGVLSMYEKYTLEGVTDMGEDNICSCENCGRAIRYVATLKDSKGIKYDVGTECAKTLSYASFSDIYEMEQRIKELKKNAEILKVLKRSGTVAYMYISKETGETAISYIAGKATEKAKAKIYEVPGLFHKDIISNVFNIRYVIGGYCLAYVYEYIEYLKGKGREKRLCGSDGIIIDCRAE